MVETISGSLSMSDGNTKVFMKPLEEYTVRVLQERLTANLISREDYRKAVDARFENSLRSIGEKIERGQWSWSQEQKVELEALRLKWKKEEEARQEQWKRENEARQAKWKADDEARCEKWKMQQRAWELVQEDSQYRSDADGNSSQEESEDAHITAELIQEKVEVLQGGEKEFELAKAEIQFPAITVSSPNPSRLCAPQISYAPPSISPPISSQKSPKPSTAADNFPISCIFSASQHIPPEPPPQGPLPIEHSLAVARREKTFENSVRITNSSDAQNLFDIIPQPTICYHKKPFPDFISHAPYYHYFSLIFPPPRPPDVFPIHKISFTSHNCALKLLKQSASGDSGPSAIALVDQLTECSEKFELNLDYRKCSYLLNSFVRVGLIDNVLDCMDIIMITHNVVPSVLYMNIILAALVRKYMVLEAQKLCNKMAVGGVILDGAVLGYWIVQKFIMSEDGHEEVGLAQLVNRAIQIIVVSFIFQSTSATLDYEWVSEGIVIDDTPVIDDERASSEVIENIGGSLRCKSTDHGLFIPLAKLNFFPELKAFSPRNGGLAMRSRIFGACKDLQLIYSIRDWLCSAFVYTAIMNHPTKASFMKPLHASQEMCKRLLIFTELEQPPSFSSAAMYNIAVNDNFSYLIASLNEKMKDNPRFHEKEHVVAQVKDINAALELWRLDLNTCISRVASPTTYVLHHLMCASVFILEGKDVLERLALGENVSLNMSSEIGHCKNCGKGGKLWIEFNVAAKRKFALAGTMIILAYTADFKDGMSDKKLVQFSSVGDQHLPQIENEILRCSIVLILCCAKGSCSHFYISGGIEQLVFVSCHDKHNFTAIMLLLLGVVEQATWHSMECEECFNLLDLAEDYEAKFVARLDWIGVVLMKKQFLTLIIEDKLYGHAVMVLLGAKPSPGGRKCSVLRWKYYHPHYKPLKAKQALILEDKDHLKRWALS